jgi:hypothetical protein
LLLLFALGAGARAQTTEQAGFAVDRFEPSDRGSDWFVLESVDWSGDLRPSAGLVADYASRPLVIYNDDGTRRSAIVADQLFTHAGAALAVADRFRFGVSLPVALGQGGTLGSVGAMSFPPPDSTALGDLRLSGAVRFFGGPRAPVALGAQLFVFLPTGKRDRTPATARCASSPSSSPARAPAASRRPPSSASSTGRSRTR